MTRRTAGPSVPVRLWAASALCVLPLGLVWSTRPGTVTPGLTGIGSCDADGFCSPGTYIPGIVVPGGTELVSQSPVRVLLVAAALAFAVVALARRTPATRRIARLATGALVVAAALAIAHRATVASLCLLAAIVLVTPPVWNLPAIRARRGSLPDRFGA